MLPQKLKIGGHVIEVLQVNDCQTENCGENFTEYNVIRINRKYPETRKQATLLHEIIHHTLSDLGYEYKEDEGSGYIHSEQAVEGLAQALYQVLHDNKLRFY